MSKPTRKRRAAATSNVDPATLAEQQLTARLRRQAHMRLLTKRRRKSGQ